MTWEPAPSVGPPWANKAVAAGIWHGGYREGVASTLEQADTHQVCEVLEGILQVQRPVLSLPAQLFDLVTSSSLGVCTRGSFCMGWDVPQLVLTSLELCWERSSCDCSSSRGALPRWHVELDVLAWLDLVTWVLLGTTALLCLSHPIPCSLGWRRGDGSNRRCPERFLVIWCLHDFSFCIGGAAVCQAGGGGGWEDLQQQPHAPHS